MNDMIELCLDVFPWISNQATCLGLETMDNRFAQLGGELFILTQQIPFSEQTGVNSALAQVVELVNKACSVRECLIDLHLSHRSILKFITPKQAQRTLQGKETRSLGVLRRIWEYKDSNTPEGATLTSEIRHSLRKFVQKNPEYHALLHFIAEFLNTTNAPEVSPVENLNSYNTEIEYPAKVNNALYTQLRIHSTCSCNTRHLEPTRLRMDCENIKQEGQSIPYDVLFVATSTPCLANDCQVLWKEAKISVAKLSDSKRKKQVAFTVQNSSPSKTSSPGNSRKLELGEFCKLIKSDKEKPVSFYVQDNAMKFTNDTQETTWRSFHPQAGVPLAEWLEKTPHLSNRVKVTLAYTIARSVWQYYSSYWMMNPWTHDNVLMVKEKIGDGNRIKPHPYLTTNLHKFKGQIMDYCLADDLFHIYPSILALGVVLIEIGAKQPFKPESPLYLWDETTINDYYEWAWTTANGNDFGKTIGATYEAVVNSCLDAELFRDGPVDPSNLDKDLEMRRSLLYEKVVLPLRQLYHAYKDDWDIQEISKAKEIAIPPQTRQTERASRTQPPSRGPFTIAIFCALTLESDAVQELFDEVWDRKNEDLNNEVRDDNMYTFGRILHHNAVLVHMAGMGKGAASQAASGIRYSYPDIKLALLVGICGGVPSYADGNDDLILGDVVISEGIVQYDFGRQFPDTFMSKSGPEVVARPGHKLRGFLAKMKGIRGREQIENHISRYLGILQGKLSSHRASYPGTHKDELFQSTYRHKHQYPSSCSLCRACETETDPVCEEARVLTCQQLGCQKGLLVQRKRLQEASTNYCPPRPKVHFGFFGSGDTVMKSGQHRDKVAAQHNLSAFEMEASTIWEMLPHKCLVIKSVCDYADSHKNKDWQNYAAATAAAGMKAVLEEFM